MFAIESAAAAWSASRLGRQVRVGCGSCALGGVEGQCAKVLVSACTVGLGNCRYGIHSRAWGSRSCPASNCVPGFVSTTCGDIRDRPAIALIPHCSLDTGPSGKNANLVTDSGLQLTIMAYWCPQAIIALAHPIDRYSSLGLAMIAYGAMNQYIW